MGSTQKQSKKIKPPKGTRDLYPEDLLRQRYITNAWRDASIRCGFEEIAGPTFETTELYSVKSGDGILGELFQAFSGKSEKEVEQVQSTGQAPFALRPEFTPTLARMYAAHAKQLPKPCKWFTAGPYFRAERPQRGRLREFLQWNVDAIGMASQEPTPESKAQMDLEVIECLIRLFEDLGIDDQALRIKLNDRDVMARHFETLGVDTTQLDTAFTLLDRREKIPFDALQNLGCDAGLPDTFISFLTRPIQGDPSQEPDHQELHALISLASSHKLSQWIDTDFNIARGLAYYTGTVFEAIADGERAVAGGGRYDNLIELFGGPPTPACGFGMGDVVLGNLLEDKGLMPTGAELMDAVARPQASIRPVAFVVPSANDESEGLVHELTANLRRGIESEDWLSRDNRKPWHSDRYRVAPMHTRITYKSTRKASKLYEDALKQHARFLIEIEGSDRVSITDMATRDKADSLSMDPGADNYVGTAINAKL
jgi:histidyl-tRNA synthetase